MAGLLALLAARLQPAFDGVAPGADPVLRPSSQAGVDFQANGALPLAKRLGRPAAEVAAEIVAGADLGDVCAKVEASTKGFINLTLADEWLAGTLAAVAADPRLGRSTAGRPLTVVVDYSAPNVAKEMHAGHVRTTIIGDALCRLLGDAGHRVIRENHVGDWGTQFGMLIEYLVDAGEAGGEELSVGDLDGFYRQARAAFDGSEEFRERSRRRVVALQSGDPETMRLWHQLVDQSMAYFAAVYRRLGVLLQPEDVVGESFYNDLLPGVVADLEAKGLLVESEGARCVFPAGFTNREGDPLPLIVQKSDGGYNYATTDLAALRDRFGRLGADRALYVVGAPQALHFEMVFAVGRAAGWVPAGKEPVHVAFGSMLGTDRKMFRTRAGDTVKLAELVDEAVQRAAAAVAAKNPELPADEARLVAEDVGIGALKYADLSTDRTRDYVFDWDRMLAFEGNTAPYLQYAHARIRSIFRRAGRDADGVLASAGAMAAGGALGLAEPEERALAVAVLGFDTAVAATLEGYSPHKLCSYLFDLAGTFTAFYERCPVLRVDDPALRESRLLLSACAAAVLESGLVLLGIAAPSRM
ncbi:MAG TPA: arginine--tRNA ligase [Acidimicrobiales bacterium]|nr:arginine--tRNA ligase [Acidimicrobiales bacterium]